MKRSSIPDYLRLFLFREGKVVIGRKLSNVWILSLVLTATFLAMAFANGSLNYLNYKMNDPFIKWVDIENDFEEDHFERLALALGKEENGSEYHYRSFSYGYECSRQFVGSDDMTRPYFKCRSFDISDTELVEAILKSDNRKEGLSPADIPEISPKSMGLFLTEKALVQLGYTVDDVPAYVDHYAYSEGADELGFHVINNRVRAPLPVLGVVKRLPGNVDVMFFTNLYRQLDNRGGFNMNRVEYASSLYYFVPSNVDADSFDERLKELLSSKISAPFYIDSEAFDPKELYSYKNRISYIDEDGYPYREHLGFRRVVFTGQEPVDPVICNAVNDALIREYDSQGVHRIFQYRHSNSQLPPGKYLSIHFDDLEKIRPFAENVVNKCDLEIEMSQINAKENFHSVSVMAIALSFVMVVFAVICVLLFIVNLLKSYFQRIKKNIGTFKAFGISNKELNRVYMIITLVLVLLSLIISLSFVTLAEFIMNLLHIDKGEGFGFLSLWNCDVISFFPPLISVFGIILVIVSTCITVRVVMGNLISATPGDLIYDR